MNEYHPRPLTQEEIGLLEQVGEQIRILFWNTPEMDEYPIPISSELGDVIFTPKANVVQSQKEEGTV